MKKKNKENIWKERRLILKPTFQRAMPSRREERWSYWCWNGKLNLSLILQFDRRRTNLFSRICCPNCFNVVFELTSLKDTGKNFGIRKYKKQLVSVTHFGHGVNFVKASSIDRDIPRTSKQLPNPFHNVVTPCRWCKCTIIGTNVTGTRWYLRQWMN